ncbi:hypothetical protein sos41_26350 [Alphaproteobacteria bacterium SO-S41]|nr:hypothetical protein sos41_26350 [Alphaproteobacteria bacterium SO-S41]
MSSFRAPLAALHLALSAAAAPSALAAPLMTLEAPNGLATLAITAAPGGGYALVAQELVPYDGGTDPRVHVFRYEDNGKLRWERVIDRRGPQIAKAITYGPGEILYVAGLDGSELTQNGYQSMLVGIGPSGNVVEDHIFGEPAPVEDFLSGIALAPDGDLYASGRIKRTPEGTADMQVMQLKPDGTVLWTDEAKNAAKESYPMIVSGSAGSFVIGTYENRKVFISRIVAGSVASFASFTQPRRCAVAQATTLPDGGLILAINLSGGNNEARLVRVSGGGEVVWDVKIPGNSVVADITRLSNGTIVVAGSSDDSDALTTTAWLKAYDESGTGIGEILPETSGETRAGGVTVDQNGGVYFAYSPIDESIPARPVPVIVERIHVQ